MRNFSILLLCGLLLINLISTSVIVRNPGCNAYDDQGVCKSCSVRFYKDANNICQPVNPNCKTYDAITGDCLSCYAGWGLLEGTCLPGLTDTASLDPNCNKFEGSACVKCSFGYFFGASGVCTKADSSCQTFNENTGECLSCYPGFALSSGKCNPQAAQPIDPNCNQLDSNNVCIKCSSGFYFSSGSCKKIDDSCKTFDMQKLNCAECYSGYVLNGDFQCIKEAPKENTNPLCAEWKNSTCLKCSKGSSLNEKGNCVLLDSYCRSFDDVTGKCLKCYSGYVFGTDGNCQVEAIKSVSDPNCYSFGGNGQCTKCSSGFYFNSLKVCVKVDDSCKAFSVSKNRCMECYPGYQIGSGGECLVANVGISDLNCAQWNGTTCVKCSLGAVFDHNGKCVIIDSQCKEYDNVVHQCKSCYSGYALDANFNCVKSVQEVNDVMCAQWEGNVCLKCAFGSYFNSQGLCTQSDASCKESDSVTGICKTCYSGYELLINNTCTKSATVTNTNTLCSGWDNTGNVCLSCSKGSFFNGVGFCEAFDPLCKTSNEMNGHCTSCYDGYGIDTNGKCAPKKDNGVSDSLCAEFTNNICTKCSSSSYFNQNNVCEPIDPSCSQFNFVSKTCIQCYPGHAIQEGKCQIDSTFTLNDPYCADFSSGICLKCSSGYYFENDGKCTAVDPLCATFNEMNGKCLSCFAGYGLHSGLCVPAEETSQDPNCASFNSDKTCKQCSKGFFTDLVSKSCQLANPLCKAYDPSNGACLECYSGYIVSNSQCIIDLNAASSLCAELIDGICVRCASRTFLNNAGQCETVSQDCRTYSDFDGNCLSCYIGFSLSHGKCSKSDVKTGCSEFTPSGQCTKCSTGYYLTSTNECGQIDPQCANFNAKLNKCEGCYSGYTLLEEKCEISKVNDQFEVKNCVAYNTDSKCIQCFDRFYLSNNQCKDVNVFCKTYDLITGQCTGCYSTFKLNNGQCTK